MKRPALKLHYPLRFESRAALIRWVLITIAASHLVGCSPDDKWKASRPKTYFTSGRVLLDGQPQAGVTVTFQPVDEQQGKPGYAVTDDDGNFTAQTFDPRDGLTEGTHRVALKKAQLIDSAGNVVTEVNSDAPLKERHLVPQRYNDFTTSKIEVQIKPEKNKLAPFELTQ